MKEYAYYEVIACMIFGSEPHKLFEETRKIEVVQARQFCMTYRKEYLKFSLGEAGSRYGKDHATVLHAKKTIKNLCDTNTEFNLKWNLFLTDCKSSRERLTIDIVGSFNLNDSEEFNVYMSELNHNYTRLMYSLNQFLKGRDDEQIILNQIDKCLVNLDSLYKIIVKK